MRIAFILVLMIVWGASTQAQDAIRNGEPFTLHITNVRSVAPEERVGFGKSWELYAVSAYGLKMSYVLYCTKSAPQTGQSYTALDEYVSANFSWLHLWPVERKTIEPPPGTKYKKGRLYRVIIIQNMQPEPHPDVACDIHSETARQP